MSELIDRYDRKIEYLRISVTNRCNLRCRYCMPPGKILSGNYHQILSDAEIEKIVRFAVTFGINKIRLTGGEPLLRPTILSLIARLASIDGVRDLALTSNGVLVARYATALVKAGLHRINISLDTLVPAKFKEITGRDMWNEVMDGIKAALTAGFRMVRVNTVILKNFNEDEILDFVEFVRERPLEVRFIEYMPVGGNKWGKEQFIPVTEIKNRIARYWELIPKNDQTPSAPSQDFRIEGFQGTVGFIAPISKGFCSWCNRLRLTADGYLRPCLASDVEIDLKSPLRAGAGKDEIYSLFKQAVNAKPNNHQQFKHDIKRTMLQIGG